MQYLGLALYVVAQAVVFLPLLYLAAFFTSPSVIPTAGILTLAVFGGLTLGVFMTGKDFSFLGPILCIGGLLAMGFIVASILFGFNLGSVFAFIMVALMSGYILYYTSNVLYHYRTDQHVAAALALFACVATLFWYILQIVSSRD
jgi:FtsH-binding integral membrane protein